MRNSRTTPGRPALLRAAAIVLAGSMGLAACAQGDEPAAGEGDADGEASIRFSWWGADTRTQKMRQLIETFEADNPDITVVPDFADWGGYWDKLATQTAGGDTPDVMMQEDRYLGDYASRGVLADLSELDVDTSEIDEVLLGSGEFDDGLWGIPTGANVYAIHANPQIFEDAGLEMPDDATWTWEDYVRISEEISEQTPQGVYGTSDYSFNEVGFMVYLRQHGQELYGEDGELAYDDDLLVEWFERSLQLQDAGAQPTADETIGLDVGETPIATNKAAMSMTWSSQLAANAEVSGHDLQLLQIPGETQLERPGMYFKPGMYVSIAADSDHLDAAARFAEFLVSSEEVGEVMLAELGVPGNARVREHVTELLPPADQRVAAFNESISGELVDAPPPMPVGAGQVADIMRRTNEAVLFGQLTPQEAAEQFRSEAQSAIG